MTPTAWQTCEANAEEDCDVCCRLASPATGGCHQLGPTFFDLTLEGDELEKAKWSNEHEDEFEIFKKLEGAKEEAEEKKEQLAQIDDRQAALFKGAAWSADAALAKVRAE